MLFRPRRLGRSVAAMQTYKVYTLEEGHIHSAPKVIAARDDVDAITQAQAFVDGHDVELWAGQRLVTKLAGNKTNP